MTFLSASDTPQAYLQRLSRWQPAEIVFWLATLLPFCCSRTICRSPARSPSPRCLRSRSISSSAMPASSRSATPRFSARRLCRRAPLEIRLGRAGERAHRGGDRGGHRRLCHELHHCALPPPRLDHADAGLRAAARRARQQRGLADRRRRRPAGHPYVAAARGTSVSISTATPPTAIRWPCCSCCSCWRGG